MFQGSPQGHDHSIQSLVSNHWSCLWAYRPLGVISLIAQRDSDLSLGLYGKI